MKRIILIALIFAVSIQLTLSQNAIKPSDEKMIRELMQTQEDSWNEGNIERFMTTYWKSQELLFVGTKGITRGWEATLQRYHRDYPDSASMGKLKFDILQISTIDKNAVFLIGRYNLTRSIGNASGMFTLVIKKIEGKWLIISDHSN